MKAAAPYSIPTEPGRGRAIALAAAVHVLLLGFLWIGVRWQNETPVSVEAEIWSPQTREAAPRAPEPQPNPPATARPAITAPVKPTLEPKNEVLPDNKPDIALEQIKKRKIDLLKKQVAEATAEEDRQQKIARKEADQERLDKERALKASRDRERLEKEQDRRRDEELAQKKTDLKKLEALKRRQQEEADNKHAEKIHADEMRRITGNLTGSGGSGDAPKSQGSRADGGYARKVASIIRSNTVFNVPEGLDGNPAVEYVVDLLPDGEVKGNPRKQKSSGVPGFDEAVLRAIEKSTFPPDKSGAVPSQIIVHHTPKD